VPTPATLAQVSNTLTVSAIAVYTLAMLAFAAEAALRIRTQALQAVRVPALAGRSGPPATATVRQPWVARPAGHHRLGRIGVSLTLLAFALHAAGVLARGAAAGRAPWGNMYEFATAGALAATAAYLTLLRKRPVRDLGVWIVAVVLLTLGLCRRDHRRRRLHRRRGRDRPVPGPPARRPA
jgi:ABC-type transport system involved in cytochrome c biogenesis permease subunit